MATMVEVQADLDRTLAEAGDWFEAGVELRDALHADPTDLDLQGRMRHVEFMYDVMMLTASVLAETLDLMSQPVPF